MDKVTKNKKPGRIKIRIARKNNRIHQYEKLQRKKGIGKR